MVNFFSSVSVDSIFWFTMDLWSDKNIYQKSLLYKSFSDFQISVLGVYTN